MRVGGRLANSRMACGGARATKQCVAGVLVLLLLAGCAAGSRPSAPLPATERPVETVEAILGEGEPQVALIYLLDVFPPARLGQVPGALALPEGESRLRIYFTSADALVPIYYDAKVMIDAAAWRIVPQPVRDEPPCRLEGVWADHEACETAGLRGQMLGSVEFLTAAADLNGPPACREAARLVRNGAELRESDAILLRMAGRAESKAAAQPAEGTDDPFIVPNWQGIWSPRAVGEPDCADLADLLGEQVKPERKVH